MRQGIKQLLAQSQLAHIRSVELRNRVEDIVKKFREFHERAAQEKGQRS